MKLRLQLPRGGGDPKSVASVAPGAPHWFTQSFDPGASAISPGGGAGLSYGTIGSVSVANGHAHRGRCGVRGCGRDESDPIHAGTGD